MEDGHPRLSRHSTSGCTFGGTGEGACPPLDYEGNSNLARTPPSGELPSAIEPP